MFCKWRKCHAERVRNVFEVESQPRQTQVAMTAGTPALSAAGREGSSVGEGTGGQPVG